MKKEDWPWVDRGSGRGRGGREGKRAKERRKEGEKKWVFLAHVANEEFLRTIARCG